jgi:hypothetical protein
LWIDAVCINQQDVTERSEQVKMMREIYERATEVIVWLGEQPVASVTTSPDAAETPLILSLAYKISRQQIATFAPIFSDVVDFRSLNDELLHLQNVPELGARAIHSLIAYPWFTRKWII